VSTRRRLLVLNQYYWPGVEATAHLLTELCEALAADYEVTVVTGRLRDREDSVGEGFATASGSSACARPYTSARG
jgi:hypothetical protein